MVIWDASAGEWRRGDATCPKCGDGAPAVAFCNRSNPVGDCQHATDGTRHIHYFCRGFGCREDWVHLAEPEQCLRKRMGAA